MHIPHSIGVHMLSPGPNRRLGNLACLCLLTDLTCSHPLQLQQFNYTWVRLIKHGEWCVAPVPDKGALALHPCDNRNNRLKWLHKSASAFHPELVSILYYNVNFQSKET